MIQWGYINANSSSGEYDVRKVTFSPSFSSTPYFGIAVPIISGYREENAYGYLSTSKTAQGTGTAISSSYMCLTTYRNFKLLWIAIGKA